MPGLSPVQSPCFACPAADADGSQRLPLHRSARPTARRPRRDLATRSPAPSTWLFCRWIPASLYAGMDIATAKPKRCSGPGTHAAARTALTGSGRSLHDFRQAADASIGPPRGSVGVWPSWWAEAASTSKRLIQGLEPRPCHPSRPLRDHWGALGQAKPCHQLLAQADRRRRRIAAADSVRTVRAWRCSMHPAAPSRASANAIASLAVLETPWLDPPDLHSASPRAACQLFQRGPASRKHAALKLVATGRGFAAARTIG